MYKTFNELKGNLSQDDVNSIVAIVCRRCQVKTYNHVRSILTYDSSKLPNYGIFGRLVKYENLGWVYQAGQSYPDEIRTVREIIIKGK